MVSNYSTSATTISNKLDNNIEPLQSLRQQNHLIALHFSSALRFFFPTNEVSYKKEVLIFFFFFFTTQTAPQICNYPFYIWQEIKVIYSI